MRLLIGVCFVFFFSCVQKKKNESKVAPVQVTKLSPFNLDSFKSQLFSQSNEWSPKERIEQCTKVLFNKDLDTFSRCKILLLKGYFYYQEKLPLLALQEYKLAISGCPITPQYANILAYGTREAAKTSVQLGIFEQAKFYYEMAMKYAISNSDSAYIYNDYALLLKTLGDYKKALHLIETGSSLNQDSSFDFTLMGNRLDILLEMDSLEPVQGILANAKYLKLSATDQAYLQLYRAQLALSNKSHLKAKDEFIRAQNSFKAFSTSFDDQRFLGAQLGIISGIAQCNYHLKNYELNETYLNNEIQENILPIIQSAFPRFLDIFNLQLKNALQLEAYSQIDFLTRLSQVIELSKTIQNELPVGDDKVYLSLYLKEIMESSCNFYAKNKLLLYDTALHKLLELNELVRAIKLKERMHRSALKTASPLAVKTLQKLEKYQLALRDSSLRSSERIYYKFKTDSLRKALSLFNPNATQFMLKDSSLSTLIYFVGKKKCYSLHGSGNKMNVSILPLDTDSLRLLCAALIQSIHERKDTFYHLSHSAYQILWPKWDLTQNKVLILPDEFLYALPFETLLTTPNSQEDYLISTWQTQYGFTLAQNSASESFNQKHLLKKNSFFHHSFRNSTQFGFIPWRTNPANKLKKHAHQTFLNTKNSKSLFLKALNEDDFVHLTTHGSFNQNSALIYFGKHDTLRINEISTIEGKAKLVMLNSCESAQGKLDQIEGPLSFANALNAIGCKSVAANLWQTNLNISQKISSHFLIGLDNTSPSASLRQAKLMYLKNEETTAAMRHPYFWAPMVLYNQSNPMLTLSKANNKKWTISIILTFTLLTLFYMTKTVR